MTQQQIDEMYMRRCLQLAACGLRGAPPNPMVGAVIVSGANAAAGTPGRIIGEGYHVHCGEGHAEVNAFASVKPQDQSLLHASTIYVSLEPCAHYGRTPPCCDLIVSKGVRRCVAGCIDPFAKVSGRGISRIREAGIEVTVGVLEDECRRLNRRFFTVQQCGRPYILLKWAQTADLRLDDHQRPLAISTPYTQMLVHRLRAHCDAILVGRVTNEREHPRLDVRHWAGPSPRRMVLGGGVGIDDVLNECRRSSLQTLLVEGGARTLGSFLDAGLWDELRIETAPLIVGDGTPAPTIPSAARLVGTETIDGNTIRHYLRENL